MPVKSEILKKIKIAEEDDLRDRLLNNRFYEESIAPRFPEKPSGFYDYALKDNLRTGSELTVRSHPLLFSLLKKASSRLGISPGARLFKSRESHQENAWVVGDGDKLLMGFVSGILNTVDSPVLLGTIIGHELGHYGFGHADHVDGVNVFDLQRQVSELECAPGSRTKDEREMLRLGRSKEFEEIALLAALLSQVCELNADRAGLVSEPNLFASIEAEMLLAGGAADGYGRYYPRDYLLQARELIALDDHLDFADMEGTHPQGPYRALALEFFWRSSEFREIAGQGPGDQGLSDFKRLLPRLVPLQGLRPSLTGYARIARQLPRFVAIAPPSEKLSTESSAVAPLVDAREPGVVPPPAPSSLRSSEAHLPEMETESVIELGDEDVEWMEAPPISATDPDLSAAMNERERAELSYTLAFRVVCADGKITNAETKFMTTLIRPRALSGEVVDFMLSLSLEEVHARGDELIQRALALTTRSRTALVKMMIQAAKADRRVDDSEITSIATTSELLGVKDAGIRQLRNVFGSRVDDVLR